MSKGSPECCCLNYNNNIHTTIFKKLWQLPAIPNLPHYKSIANHDLDLGQHNSTSKILATFIFSHSLDKQETSKAKLLLKKLVAIEIEDLMVFLETHWNSHCLPTIFVSISAKESYVCYTKNKKLIMLN